MNYPIRSILAITDFSDAAVNAVETAAGIARRQQALLHLVHVDETVYDGGAMQEEKGANWNVRLSEHAAELEKKHGIRCISRVINGSVCDAVIGYSQGMNCDLVVMGTRALPQERSHAIGRHAFSVLLRSQVPLLVVPVVARVEAFTNIVFPVRAVSNATDKYSFLKPIIAQNNATLHVAGMADEGSDECSAYVGSMVEILSRQLEREGVKFSAETHCCTPVPDAILDLVNEKSADLLVVTASLEADFLQLFSSSFTKTIMKRASTAVLFLRPDGDYAAAKRHQAASLTSGISSVQLFKSLN